MDVFTPPPPPDCFTSWKELRYLFNRWLGRSLHSYEWCVKKEKSITPVGIRNPDRAAPIETSYPLRYTASYVQVIRTNEKAVK